MHEYKKIFLIIFASAFGLIIIGAIVGGIMESHGTFTKETVGPKGIAAIKIFTALLTFSTVKQL